MPKKPEAGTMYHIWPVWSVTQLLCGPLGSLLLCTLLQFQTDFPSDSKTVETSVLRVMPFITSKKDVLLLDIIIVFFVEAFFPYFHNPRYELLPESSMRERQVKLP